MAEVEIRTNLPELKRHLDQIGKQMSVKVVRAATAAASNVFKKWARTHVPKLTGRLHKSLFVKRQKDSTSGKEHYSVGVRYKRFQKVNGRSAYKQVVKREGGGFRVQYFGAFYWRWVHEGHKFVARAKPDRNTTKNKVITVRKKNGTVYTRTVKFSSEGLRARRRGANVFVQGNPFLDKSFTSGKTEALRKFFDIADKRIQKISQERTQA